MSIISLMGIGIFVVGLLLYSLVRMAVPKNPMWIVSGILKGIGVFVAGLLLYGLVRLAFISYKADHAVIQGTYFAPGTGSNLDVRGLYYNHYLWAFLVVSIVLGLILIRYRR